MEPPAFAADGWDHNPLAPPTVTRCVSDNEIGGAQEEQVQKEIPNWFSFYLNRPPSLYYSTDPKNWRYPSSLSSGSAGESVDAPHSYGPHRLVHLSICDRAICVCFIRSFLSSSSSSSFFIIMISEISPASVCSRLVALIAPLSFPPAAHTRLVFVFFTANPSIGQQFASHREMLFMQIQPRKITVQPPLAASMSQ